MKVNLCAVCGRDLSFWWFDWELLGALRTTVSGPSILTQSWGAECKNEPMRVCACMCVYVGGGKHSSDVFEETLAPTIRKKDHHQHNGEHHPNTSVYPSADDDGEEVITLC